MTASCSTRRGGGKNKKMVKNMKNEMKNENRDDLGAIGIGAMIVFIALILVAAVASAVIIQTAEKLQQNAQSTGEDTTDMMAGKIFITSVVLVNAPTAGAAADDLYITFELAPGSDPIDPADVEYNLICLETGARTGAATQSGNFGTVAGITATAASALGTAGAVDPLNPAVTYTVTLTPTGDCAPQVNTDDTFVIQAGGGGFTYEIFKYGGGIEPGEVVV